MFSFIDIALVMVSLHRDRTLSIQALYFLLELLSVFKPTVKP